MIKILSINCAKLSIKNVEIVASRQGIMSGIILLECIYLQLQEKKSNLSPGQRFQNVDSIFTMSFVHIGRVYSASPSGLRQLGFPERFGPAWVRPLDEREKEALPARSSENQCERRRHSPLFRNRFDFFAPLSLSLLYFRRSPTPTASGINTPSRKVAPICLSSLLPSAILSPVASREIHLQGRNSPGIMRNISSFHIA